MANFLQQGVLGLYLTEGEVWEKNYVITVKFYFSGPVCLF